MGGKITKRLNIALKVSLSLPWAYEKLKTKYINNKIIIILLICTCNVL